MLRTMQNYNFVYTRALEHLSIAVATVIFYMNKNKKKKKKKESKHNPNDVGLESAVRGSGVSDRLLSHYRDQYSTHLQIHKSANRHLISLNDKPIR